MAPGTPVPPERELAQHYGTSRTTVRQALAELVVEGGCCGMQGKGTFVAKPKVAQMLELASYTEGMRAQGLHPQTRILDTSYVAADAQLAELLAIPPGSRVLRIHRLRLADGEPMSMDASHLSARRFPGLRRNLDRHPSLYEALATDYGVELAEAQETIETVLADPKDARLLGVDVGMPLLLLSRHAFDVDGTPVEWAQSRYRGRPLQAGHPAAPGKQGHRPGVAPPASRSRRRGTPSDKEPNMTDDILDEARRQVLDGGAGLDAGQVLRCRAARPGRPGDARPPADAHQGAVRHHLMASPTARRCNRSRRAGRSTNFR